MKYPIEITVKIDIQNVKERFMKEDVQTIITDRLYQVGDAILRALELENEYKLVDLSRATAGSTSWAPAMKQRDIATPDSLEALLYAIPLNPTAEADNDRP